MAEEGPLPLETISGLRGQGSITLSSDQRAIVNVEGGWFFASKISGEKNSLIALILASVERRTTSSIRKFMEEFRLSMRAVFLQNKEQTTCIITSICKQIRKALEKSATSVDMSVADDLKYFADELKFEKDAESIRTLLLATVDAIETAVGKQIAQPSG